MEKILLDIWIDGTRIDTIKLRSYVDPLSELMLFQEHDVSGIYNYSFMLSRKATKEEQDG